MIITVELVDEIVATSNNAIAEEVLRWFKGEKVPAPLVKEMKKGCSSGILMAEQHYVMCEEVSY